MDIPGQHAALRGRRENAKHPRPQEHGRGVHFGRRGHRGRRRPDCDRDGLQEAPDTQAEAHGVGETRGRQVARGH